MTHARSTHARSGFLWALFLALALVAAVDAAARKQNGGDVLEEIAEETTEAVEGEEDPLSVEAAQLAQRLLDLRARRDDLDAQVSKATGEDQRILAEQIWRNQLDAHAALLALTENVLRQEKAGADVADLKGILQAGLTDAFPLYMAFLDRKAKDIDALRKARDEAEPNDRPQLEEEIARESERIRVANRALLDVVEHMEKLGLEIGEQSAKAGEVLMARAEKNAARVRLERKNLASLTERAKGSPDDADLKAQITNSEADLQRATGGLSATVALLHRLDIETAQYQQLLIETTGEISADILDPEVVLGLVRGWLDRLREGLATHGPSWVVKALVFFLILAAFRVVAAITRRVVVRAVRTSRVKLSQLLQDTLVSWSSTVVMMLGFLVALSQLGIQIAPLLAGLGIAGFVLGFALQDVLSNFASGAMILLYRPFDVEDVVEAAGISGKVSRMSLVSTTIHTFDNQTLIVPNNKIWGDVIRNVTAQTLRRVDLVFGIGYGDDVEHAEAVLRDVVVKHEKVLAEPEPMIKLHELGDSSVNFVVRPWVRTVDYWDVYWDIMREVKLRFDREGISIPFPQRDVHIHNETT